MQVNKSENLFEGANLYSRILELCKTKGDTMYSLSKHSGVSESVLSRLKSNTQSKLSKKNLILLANYFCVNETWLETGEGDRDAPGVVRDVLIHDGALWERFVMIAKSAFGDKPLSESNFTVGVNMEMMSAYTDIPQDRIWKIIYDSQFPSYTEILQLLKSDKRLDANWLLLGVGSMYRELASSRDTERVSTKELERIGKLNGIIESLQEVIDAKNAQIAMLTERVRQLDVERW